MNLRTVTAVAVCVGALAGCGGGSSTPSAKAIKNDVKPFVAPSTSSTSAPEPSTTTTTIVPANARALATKLGCTKAESSPSMPVSGFPSPREEVSCTVGGVDLDIAVFANHADLDKVYTEPGQTALCALFKGFGVTGPQYVVNGSDFSVSASSTPPGGNGLSVGTRAQADALSTALGLPVTTLCA